MLSPASPGFEGRENQWLVIATRDHVNDVDVVTLEDIGRLGRRLPDPVAFGGSTRELEVPVANNDRLAQR